jgi:hypothetical protein
VDSYDRDTSEAEEEDQSLSAEARKRKANDKDLVRRPQKKAKLTVGQYEDTEKNRLSSAKINKLCEILDTIRRNDPTEKSIVFSQVSCLDSPIN